MAAPVRLLLVALLIWGLLVPKVSAALAGLGLLDLREVVICAHDGLRTVTLNGEGRPVDLSGPAHCMLAKSLDGASPPVPEAFCVTHRPAGMAGWAAERPKPADGPAAPRARSPPAA